MRDYLRGPDRFHFARKGLPFDSPAILHTHDYYECFWILSGVGSHHINGRSQPLTPGRVTFIRPHDVHGFQSAPSEICRLVNIMVPAAVVDHLGRRYGDEFAGRYFWYGEPQPAVVEVDPVRMGDLRRLERNLELGRRTLARIEGFLIELLTGVLAESQALPPHAPRWLVAACTAAQTPEIFRLGAAGFVRAAARSHEHVCRATKHYLGQTPTDYVNGLRMAYAARRLAGTDDPVAEIAHDCGFEHLSHFYRLFTRTYGEPPRRYRQHRLVEVVQPGR